VLRVTTPGGESVTVSAGHSYMRGGGSSAQPRGEFPQRSHNAGSPGLRQSRDSVTDDPWRAATTAELQSAADKSIHARRAAGNTSDHMVHAGLHAGDTKRALDWLEQHFGSSAGAAALAMETEQIVAALRNMLGAAAEDPTDNKQQNNGSTTPMRSTISFAEDVELQQRQRQRQQQQLLQQQQQKEQEQFQQQQQQQLLQQHQMLQQKQQQQQASASLSLSPSAAAASEPYTSNNGSSSSPASCAPPVVARMTEKTSPRCPAYPGHRSASPMGFTYRPRQGPAAAAGELSQQRQQQQQQQRRCSSDHMQLSSSWEGGAFPGGSWGSPSPRGGAGGSIKASRGAKQGSWSTAAKLPAPAAVTAAAAAASAAAAAGSAGNGVMLADDPAFQEACRVSCQ